MNIKTVKRLVYLWVVIGLIAGIIYAARLYVASPLPRDFWIANFNIVSKE